MLAGVEAIHLKHGTLHMLHVARRSPLCTALAFATLDFAWASCGRYLLVLGVEIAPVTALVTDTRLSRCVRQRSRQMSRTCESFLKSG